MHHHQPPTLLPPPPPPSPPPPLHNYTLPPLPLLSQSHSPTDITSLPLSHSHYPTPTTPLPQPHSHYPTPTTPTPLPASGCGNLNDPDVRRLDVNTAVVKCGRSRDLGANSDDPGRRAGDLDGVGAGGVGGSGIAGGATRKDNVAEHTYYLRCDHTLGTWHGQVPNCTQGQC